MLINRNFILNNTDIQISKSVYEDVLNEQINNAEFIDIQTLIGSDFYNHIIRNVSDAKIQKLLDKGDYDYNGVTYTNLGLKTVIAYYTKARYVKFGGFVDTPFSFVEKTQENSQIVSEKSKQTLYKENQTIAYNYWVNVQTFLNRNSADYPLWNNTKCTTNKKFKIYKL